MEKRIGLCIRFFWILIFVLSFFSFVMVGHAQEPMSPDIKAKLERLKAEIVANHYTHTVGYNPAMKYSLDQLCGLVPPENWRSLAPWDDMVTKRHFLSSLGLPQKFDWRNYLNPPPARNQGNCGSCWAFATVAPLEFEISHKNGVVEDLSEQYLVSCNDKGYGCNGGWFAHDMHINPGAVWEVEFPYEAQETACGGPYNHPYHIDEWYYVGDGGNSIPTPEQVKLAIYTYGPVAAAICAGDHFQAYTGGIFNVDESFNCGSSYVNHAIVLVGWDDTVQCGPGQYGAWILRNSWGPSWGEDGYMKICYGVSNVGFAANYIVYNSLLQQYTLSVNKTGSGSGTVTSSPAGINCGGD